jgi:tetratricopeptide (TPR) repeat protein
MKILVLGFLLVLSPLHANSATHEAAPATGHGAADHHAADSAPAAAPAPVMHAPTAETATPAVETPPAEKKTDGSVTAEEVASLLHIGDLKLEQQDWESSLLAYGQVLAAGRKADAAQIRSALLGLARAHRGARDLTKACAVYERYIKNYPGDEQLPVVFLELGRCLRALGANRLAIARFYSVLNSTLKLPVEGSDIYRQLARTAQFEIAETYFQAGDYDQSFRFYSRLRLLDLAPADRARAAFKSAYSLNLKGDHEKAVTNLRSYLSTYPDGENAAEARNLLAVALRRLGRTQESLSATLELLKVEQSRTAADPKTWTYWQRKTGNQLANEFYEQGDINTALVIYQTLRDLGGPPEWLLPVEYQIGLCQERLHRVDLARTTYQSILDSLRRPVADNGKHPAILADIDSMVAWRLQHLDWLDSTEKRLMLFSRPVESPAPAPSTTAAAGESAASS